MQKLQCEICGGSLMMTEDGESAVCESCGMRFKKETIKKMILELSGPVQVEGIQNVSSVAEKAETFLRLGEAEKAKAAFQQLTDDYPADYRGWWGMTRLFDWDAYFYTQGKGEAQPPQVCQRALQFANADAKAEIQQYFNEQISAVKSRTDARHDSEEQRWQTLEQDYRHRCLEYEAVKAAASIEAQKATQAYKKARERISFLRQNMPKQPTTFLLRFPQIFITITLLSILISILGLFSGAYLDALLISLPGILMIARAVVFNRKTKKYDNAKKEIEEAEAASLSLLQESEEKEGCIIALSNDPPRRWSDRRLGKGDNN